MTIPREIQITLAEALAIAVEVSDDASQEERVRYFEAARYLNLDAEVIEYLSGRRPIPGSH